MRRLALLALLLASCAGPTPPPTPTPPPIPTPIPTPTPTPPPTPPTPPVTGGVAWDAWQSVAVGDTAAVVATKIGPERGTQVVEGRTVLLYTVAHPTLGAITGLVWMDGGKVMSKEAW